tara:strand:- start:1980 stop:2306 length:327 start_codon:yes stop_codon:yes gene_type:complete
MNNNNNTIESWTPGADSFYEGREVYRISNSKDSEKLKNNIGKKIYVRVFLNEKYDTEYWSFIPKRFRNYDRRDINDVPIEEKSWNKSSNGYVPSRYIWEIKNMRKETV